MKTFRWKKHTRVVPWNWLVSDHASMYQRERNSGKGRTICSMRRHGERGKTLTPYNLYVGMPIHYKTSYWGTYATQNSNYILHTYSLWFQAWLPKPTKMVLGKKRNKGIQAGKFWLIIDAISALRGVIRHGNGSGWLHRRKLSMTWLIKLESALT